MKLAVFDLDGTLAPSKSPMEPEMSATLARLLDVVPVAIISGGDFPQFQKQLIGGLPAGAPLDRLYILPTCGTKFFDYRDGQWQKRYSEDFTALQKQTIVSALEKAVAESGLGASQTWGPAIEDRGSQITYSALGQEAPLDAKRVWDPDFTKRRKIQAIVQPMLPQFSVAFGGTTSIDVTAPGIDKAYGIRKLRDILGIPIEQMLFMGDALFPGGNDEPARSTGVTCIAVRDPQETQHIVEGIVFALSTV